MAADPSTAPTTETVTAACLVASAGADRIQARPSGSIVVAGDGNDVIEGSAMRDTVLGDDGDDEILGGLGSDHLDGGFGNDRIEGGDNGDLILGGPGDDTIFGEQAEGTPTHPGPDIIHGGPGRDTIDGGQGKDQIFGSVDGDTLRGGDDDDTLIGNQGDDELEGGEGLDWLSGGAGNDTLRGGLGSDKLHAGLGRDAAYGEDGDDTFIIQGECEIEPGELIDGGPGADLVMSPFTEQELLDRGVKLVSIETFRQRWHIPRRPNALIGSDKVCRFQDPTFEVIEVSGTVTPGTDVLIMNKDGSFHQPDGKRLGGRSVYTRYQVQVDTVYLGGVQQGETISILLPGGSVEIGDGSTITQTACCFTPLHEERRYRLVLRELRADDGTRSGWQYEMLTESPPNHSLVLPLGAHGPITFASMGPFEHYGPPCPEVPQPGSFASNRKAIQWANSLGHRWDQTVDLCGGADPCMVAAPPASMDYNMTTPDGCVEPETFRFVFGDAARLISNGGIIDGTWGVHPPGVSTNPTSLRACDTSKDDDGLSCIALDLPREDLGGASQQLDLNGFNGKTNVRDKVTMKSMSWPTLQQALEFDLTLDHDLSYGDVCVGFGSGVSFSQLATHELGHAFGLAHVEDGCDVNMFESQVAQWGEHERARLRVLYPSHELEFPDNVYAEP
jgi:RTX calcium-binding nonapeptide repeat (4 copies)